MFITAAEPPPFGLASGSRRAGEQVEAATTAADEARKGTTIEVHLLSS
jgi:hypothetical protein